MRRWSPFLFGLAALDTSDAAGQKGQPSGAKVVVAVRHAETGESLPAANVSLEDLGRSERPDSLGITVFLGVPAGNHTLRVRKPGMRNRVVPVHVRSDDSVRVEVALVEVATALPAVRVDEKRSQDRLSPGLAEFEERRTKRPFGHFIAEEEIRTAIGSDIRNFVMSRLPGLRIEPAYPGAVEMYAFSTRGPYSVRSGSCRADVYLDGARVPGGEVTRLPLSSLAGIEWYSPGTVPVRYKSSSSGLGKGEPNPACGVLLLWSAW